jgi:hypothetical protein
MRFGSMNRSHAGNLGYIGQNLISTNHTKAGNKMISKATMPGESWNCNLGITNFYASTFYMELIVSLILDLMYISRIKAQLNVQTLSTNIVRTLLANI